MYRNKLKTKKRMRAIFTTIALCVSLCAHAFNHKGFIVNFDTNEVRFANETYELVETKVTHQWFSRTIEYRTIKDNKMVVFYLTQFSNGKLKLQARKFKN